VVTEKIVVNPQLTLPVRADNLPKSNLPGFWIGLALQGLGMSCAAITDKSSTPGWNQLVSLAGVSCLPLSIAVAELRSGYAWKNLAEGGRGVARTAAPGRFWRSISLHLLLAVAINAFNLWAFFRPELPGR
jgi:hypothetical protein